MDFNQITKASDAIAYIKAHPGMTTAQLQQIARQMETGIGNATVKIAYSGDVSTSNGNIPSWRLAEGIKEVYPAGQVGTITGTEFEILVKDTTFTDALLGSVNNNRANFNEIYNGTDLSGKVRIPNLSQPSIWDEGSSRYIKTGSQPIINVVDDFRENGVWTSTEVKAMLDSHTPSIDGVARADLQQLYDTVKAVKGEAYAYNALATHMNINARANMKDNLHVTFKADGAVNTVDKIGVGSGFWKGAPGLSGAELPANTKGLTSLGEILHDIDHNKVLVMEEVSDILGDNKAFLGKIGVAGELMIGIHAVLQADAAYAAGDTAGAEHIMGEYFAGLAGEIAGGAIGLQGGLLIGAALLTIGTPGIIVGGLALVVTVIVSELGGEAAKWLYNFLSDILSDAGISDLLSDAAALFGRAFSSPIVIDLNNNGFEMVHSRDGAHFDIDADGFAEKSGWVKPSDAFLVRDANGNGVIDSQKEMFGTDAASTAAAKLAALDVVWLGMDAVAA